MVKYLLIILILLIPLQAFSETVSCDGSQSDCQTKITAASDGDIISIDPGTFNWSTGTTAISWSNKNITVQGAGIDKTIINFADTFTLGFSVTDSTKASFRITGMTINALKEGAGGLICFKVDSSASTSEVYGWRIDNVKINSSATATNKITGFVVYGINYGLIDNCQFDGAGFVTVSVAPYVTGEYGITHMGDTAWALPLDLGTYKAVYVENCEWNFTSATQGSVDDLVYGGALVFRYNTVNETYLQTHEARLSERGPRKYEIYNNVFAVTNNRGWPMHILGGTGVIFNNTISGYTNNNIIVSDPRADGYYDDDAILYGCDGSRAWDGNIEATGWPCLDQIGRESGSAFGDAQASEPLYAWSNGDSVIEVQNPYQVGGRDQTLYIKATNHATQEVTDFVNGGSTAKAGYTRHTCPHPLAGSGSCDENTAGRGGYRFGNTTLGSGSTFTLGSGAGFTLQ